MTTTTRRAAEHKMKLAWRTLRRDPELPHRASVRLAHARTLPCRDTDNAEIFFPPQGNSTDLTQARRLCSHCPALAQLDCLAVALAAGPSYQYGISAGITAKTRSTFINQQRRIERALAA